MFTNHDKYIFLKKKKNVEINIWFLLKSLLS